MTREQIEINRRLIIRELEKTGREGMDRLVGLMDKFGFFTSRSDSHDNSEGGTANHALWVLYFARKMWEDEAKKAVGEEQHIPAISEESLTMVCLCHDICNCGYPTIPNTVHGDRSEAILTKSGCRFEKDELTAIRYHSEESVKVAKNNIKDHGTVSTAITENQATMLHRLLHNADRLSVEYADSIPFGTDPAKPFRKKKADKYIDIIFDADDHRMWAGAKGRDDVFDGSETLSEFPVHHVQTIPVRPEGNGKDLLVLFDDNAFFSLMFLSEEGNKVGKGKALVGEEKGNRQGRENLYRSDKVMFGYTDLIFYISRFPQYRSSYIVARNAKGFWGVIRIRKNHKDNGEHLILQERVVDFAWRSSEKAVEHMRSHTGHLIRVLDQDFYSKITL